MRLLAVLAFTIPHLLFAQTRPDSISKLLKAYGAKFHQEKIYVHIDKPHYFPGDTIWFKVYLVEASNHLADTASKTINIDMFRKGDDRKVAHVLLRNEGGFARGYLPLSDTIRENTYEIRGYTSWMRNFSDTDFFYKELLVQKRSNSKNALTQNGIADDKEIVDLQFFPEGGNLVAGMQGRVGFKSINKFGRGVDFSAFIISDRKDTVATIRSQHLGMGSFIFQPKEGEKYFAIIEKSAHVKPFYLPAALPEGYAFFVDNLTYKDKIKVIARNNLSNKDKPVLIGQVRGIIVCALQGTTESHSFSWFLPKAEMGEQGVLQLTLFTGAGVPQCERLVYLNTEPPLQVSVLPDKATYAPHEKVTLSIQVKDHLGEPVQGNFSLSAVDAGQVYPNISGQNIYNYLYLTSDIQSLSDAGVKGLIEQPDYYFDPSDQKASINLDILLMTQGWRRFRWSQIFQKQWNNPAYPIEKGIALMGKAHLNKRNSGKSIPISLTYFERGVMGYSATMTDDVGAFTFPDLQLINGAKVILQGSGEKDRSLKLTIDSLHAPSYPPHDRLGYRPFADLYQVKFFTERQSKLADLDAQVNFGKNKLLKEVVLRVRRNAQMDPRKALYRTAQARTLEITNEICSMYPTTMDMLRGRLPSVQVITNRAGQPVITVRGINAIRGNYSPAVLVDGVQYDPSILMSIPTCSVASIDVVTSLVPALGTPGLISILTRTNTSSNNEVAPAAEAGGIGSKVYGYQLAREFYSPNYDKNEVDKNALPDVRSTLYWNPLVITDINGNAKVTFWNSNERTSIHVSVEGISIEGKPAVATKDYRVE